MITRAYQNAEGERQEVTLSPEVWESITEEQLQRALGFGKLVAKAAPAAKKAAAKKK